MMIDRTGLSVLSYKHLLLPVWTGLYTYKSESYRILINGQTGQVVGDTPHFVQKLKRLFVG
jgi:hypothetical protein